MIREYYKNKEESIEAISKYLSERDGIKSEEIIDVAKEFTKKLYCNNARNVASIMYTQDIFFDRYKDSIESYMKYCGVNCYISCCCPVSSYLALYILTRNMNQLSELSKKTYKYWDPNEEWKDFSYTDDIYKNITNPINEFYSAFITIKNPNKNFVDHMMTYFRSRCTMKDNNFSVKLLPARKEFLFEFIKALHKYF